MLRSRVEEFKLIAPKNHPQSKRVRQEKIDLDHQQRSEALAIQDMIRSIMQSLFGQRRSRLDDGDMEDLGYDDPETRSESETVGPSKR